LLRHWLPQGYHVRTKGRILSDKNVASKQLDVIVLKPNYPRKLLGIKTYLAAGVAAAFECKLSIKTVHIKKSFETMKNVLEPRKGSIYEELHSPVIYGILAHSHSWKSPRAKPVENVTKTLRAFQNLSTLHPREMVDVVCVADLGTWSISRNPAWGRGFEPFGYGLEGFTQVVYMCASKADPEQTPAFTPIGLMLAFLWRRLGFEDASIRPLARYFWRITGPGAGMAASGPPAQFRRNDLIFSNETLAQMRAGRREHDWWDYWRHSFD
jgi:hypothetical protein